MRGLVVRSAARASPGASRRPQGKVTGPITGCRGLCRPYGSSCRANLISPRSKRRRRSALPQGSPKGRRMTSATEKWPGFPRAERNATPGPVGTRPRPTTPPPRTGRTEREHVASWFGVNPTTGSGTHSRQSGNSSAKVCHDRPRSAASLLWVAEVVDAGGEAVGGSLASPQSVATGAGPAGPWGRRSPGIR